MLSAHLRKGSEFPTLQKDVLRIYSMRYCPFAQTTLLTLEHKRIPYDLVNINLKDKPDWFLDRTPVGLVPVLERNDKVLYESAVCNIYLDEAYDVNKLLPGDPYQKGKISNSIARIGKLIPRLFAVIISRNDDEKLKVEHAQFLSELQNFEIQLTDKSYFGGTSVGLLDLHVWVLVERIGAMDAIAGTTTMTKERFPELVDWVLRMRELPAVKATTQDTETHRKFIETHIAGTPAYDD